MMCHVPAFIPGTLLSMPQSKQYPSIRCAMSLPQCQLCGAAFELAQTRSFLAAAACTRCLSIAWRATEPLSTLSARATKDTAYRAAISTQIRKGRHVCGTSRRHRDSFVVGVFHTLRRPNAKAQIEENVRCTSMPSLNAC